MVDPPDIFQQSVGAPPRQVAGTVQTLARRAERMRDEGLGGAQRIADVATTDAGAGHAQLAHRAQRHQFEGVVGAGAEQVQAVVVGGTADRQVGALGGGQVDAEERHVVGAFRRPVGIHQADPRVALEPLARQFRRHRLAGGQHPAQAVEGLALFGEHALDQRRHAFQHRDALFADVRQQALRIVGDGVRHDRHAGAEQRRGEELPDRDVEALRGGLGDHVVLVQFQVRDLAQLVVEHARLLHHHALRQSGGAGGVDHVGEVLRPAVDLRIVLGALALLDLVPHQQARPVDAAEFVEQRQRLLAAGLGADQHRRAAQLDDPGQALGRMAGVERQVAGTGLEAADDHAEQVEAALGQQCHRLVDADAGGAQGVAEAVGPSVQLGVAPALFQATGGDALRMGCHLRLEQPHVALLQRVVAGAAVAAVEEEVALVLAEQRQGLQFAVETVGQGQQQALELAEQALDGRRLEVALVVGQVQAEVITRIADHGQREVGVGTPGV